MRLQRRSSGMLRRLNKPNLWLLLISSTLCAGPTNFTQAKRELIEIYAKIQHLEDFYCKTPFIINKDGKTPKLEINTSSPTYTPRNKYTKKGKLNKRARIIEVEHIMPAQNFGKHLSCWKNGGRKACAKDPTFRKMESDMRNLVLAIGEINGDRNNFRYAQAPKDLNYTQYGNCKVYTDFRLKRFYPADYSKGQIARAYLYMSETYNIKLSNQEKKLMESWDKMYPMNEFEKQLQKHIQNF